jgi:hypothetical protein
MTIGLGAVGRGRGGRSSSQTQMGWPEAWRAEEADGDLGDAKLGFSDIIEDPADARTAVGEDLGG